MKTQSSISTIGDSGHINIAAIGSTGVVIVNVKDKATGNILDFNALAQGTYTLDNKTAYTSDATYSSTTYVLTFNSDISELTGDLVISSNQVPINRIDGRSQLYLFPTDSLFVVNEAIITTGNKMLTIVPLKFSEYSRLMSKPFKRPLKNQAWRLINSAASNKTVEIITNIGDTISMYNIRYVKRPRPIVLANLADTYQNISIQGYTTVTECELDAILHPEILERAVELAKSAQTGDLKSQVELGERSE